MASELLPESDVPPPSRRQPQTELTANWTAQCRRASHIGRYERDLAERTRAHGGRIVQTTDDGILADFPVPATPFGACALIDVSDPDVQACQEFDPTSSPPGLVLA